MRECAHPTCPNGTTGKWCSVECREASAHRTQRSRQRVIQNGVQDDE